MDEIHKSKGWKQKLKGLYDELADEIRIIVTGSARLNVFKKGGDSLMGRYLNTNCPAVQVVFKENIWRMDGLKIVASATKVFSGLP